MQNSKIHTRGDCSSTVERQIVDLEVAGASPVGHPRICIGYIRNRSNDKIAVMWVPANFEPPFLEKETYRARKLTARDTKLDFKAVMSSIDIIHKTRGGKWPTEDLTLEEDRIDLSWHQREFEFKTSFAFTVMNKDETECLGCIYFYPPIAVMSDAASKDDVNVSISWWVTQKMYDQGFYDILSKDIKEWVESKWPFKKVFWANKTLPEGFSFNSNDKI